MTEMEVVEEVRGVGLCEVERETSCMTQLSMIPIC